MLLPVAKVNRTAVGEIDCTEVDLQAVGSVQVGDGKPGANRFDF